MELREFIEARLADDQKIAEDASALDNDWPFWVEADDDTELESADAFRRRLGPARVLRDVEAKRRLIDAILRYEAFGDGERGCCHDAEAIGRGGCPEIRSDEIKALRLLALPYSDHADFDPSWLPEARV